MEGGIYLLVAKDRNGRLCSLFSKSKEELDDYRKQEFFCPCCQSRVNVKAGAIKLPHFAHSRNQSCNYTAEPESEEHMKGKLHLYEWLRKQGLQVELEKYLPELQQRPDLFLKWNNEQYAIEFQCSIIPLEQIKQRTRNYIRYRIVPIWILNSRFLKVRNEFEYHVSAFLWSATFGKQLFPNLLFYSPTTYQFTKLQQLTPFSSKITFAYSKEEVNPTFFSLLQVDYPKPFAFHQWMQKKRAWRNNAHLFANFVQPFHLALYESSLQPASLPNEIGLPVPYMHLFETSVIHWQFWLCKETLLSKNIGDTVTTQEWRAKLIKCMKEKKILLRILPSNQSTNPFLPVEQYIHLLIKLNILAKKSKDSFTIMRKMEPFTHRQIGVETALYEKVASIYHELFLKEYHETIQAERFFY